MSGRKNSLQPYPIVSDGQMAADIQSSVTNIGWLDNIGIQVDLTNTAAAGRLSVEVSANYQQDFMSPPNVLNAGTWVELTGQTIAAGEPLSTYFDLNQLSAPYIRLTWTSSVALEQEITTVADDGGSLNSTYFLITDGEGEVFAVWFDVDDTGEAPTVPGATLVEVNINEDDSADDVATALATALDAITASFSAAAVADVVTVTNEEVGDSALAEDVDTGFTFEATSGQGILNAVITGKML